ncbi:hypothetical protein R6Q57_011057 [Mikania cordata]
MFEEIQKIKRRCEYAKKLAKISVEKDKSLKETKSRLDKSIAKFHKYKGHNAALEKRDLTSAPDTPLMLAVGFIYTDPITVKYIDGDGRNILHVAIKYRRMDIIDIVTNMAHSIRRLRGKIDKKGYSLLHMLSVQAKDNKADDDIRNPALILRDDLILFEAHVESMFLIFDAEDEKSMHNLIKTATSFNGDTAEQMLLDKTINIIHLVT